MPSWAAADLTEGCERYKRVIATLGGVDLQLLGIGENRHIGFNEPGTSFLSKTNVVQLSESTREVNSRCFHSLKEVPTHAISMEISTIMQSKQILLLASGKKKARILEQLLSGEIHKQMPASF
ncbi:6-phosphogluconolactonase [Sporosarcina globispora]|uniref:6-phosphogluconolactonase n=1 Tax=Sporosarcina globispora TaxID=1459 RepID=UPI002E81FF7D|nr:6-phosphogluconolactonase [Sporosarcina globispora]